MLTPDTLILITAVTFAVTFIAAWLGNEELDECTGYACTAAMGVLATGGAILYGWRVIQ